MRVWVVLRIAFDVGEGHHGEGQDHQGGTGEGSAQLAPVEVRHADGKARTERLPLAHLGGGEVRRMALQFRHFMLKTQENDPGHQKRQAHDEKRQDHHHRAVGELEGGM